MPPSAANAIAARAGGPIIRRLLRRRQMFKCGQAKVVTNLSNSEERKLAVGVPP
jgi:hypothetical protein